MSEIITFPGSSSKRGKSIEIACDPKGWRSRPYTRRGPNMQTVLFRSRELIMESDEADLVRDVCLDLDKAEKKLKAIRQRLQGVKEQAAQVQFLTAAETKLTAAIVAALLTRSIPNG